MLTNRRGPVAEDRSGATAAAALSAGALRTLARDRQMAIGRLLLLARRDFARRAHAAMLRRGIRPLPDGVIRLLPYLEVEGVRASELAARTGLTKQRISTLARQLEALGVVRRVPDREDGRAARIEFTRRGLRYVSQTRDAVREVERAYARQLGGARFEAMRTALAEIAYGGAPIAAGPGAARR